MNNELAAWIGVEAINSKWSFGVVTQEKRYESDVPLYTHPIKELNEQFKKGFKAGKEEGWKAHKFHHPVKELTDEEIFKMALEQYGHSVGLYGNHIGFARAILRKAQEK
jgi:hypothetical protein